MARDPYSWVDQFANTSANMRSQAEAQKMQALLSLFQEEAMRQRPYVTMPAELAQAQQNRINAEPFDVRAEQRRYANSVALIGARAKAKADAAGSTTGDVQMGKDENGNDVLIIDGVQYPA